MIYSVCLCVFWGFQGFTKPLRLATYRLDVAQAQLNQANTATAEFTSAQVQHRQAAAAAAGIGGPQYVPPATALTAALSGGVYGPPISMDSQRGVRTPRAHGLDGNESGGFSWSYMFSAL